MRDLDDTVKEVLDLLQIKPGYYHVCVAGGAVRDLLVGRVPKDVDMYFFCPQYALKERLARAIDSSILDAAVANRTFQETMYNTSDVFPLRKLQVNGFDVDLMCTQHNSIPELVGSFDWNICYAAYDPFTRQLYDTQNVQKVIEEKWPLTLIRMTNPFSNLRRGYRFSERYGLNILTSDIKELCGEVVKRININGGPDVPDNPKPEEEESEELGEILRL